MNTPAIIEITREHNPFPRDGIRTGADGIPRYPDLPAEVRFHHHSFASQKPSRSTGTLR